MRSLKLCQACAKLTPSSIKLPLEDQNKTNFGKAMSKHITEDLLSPTQIRSVLSENLRILVDRSESVSQICRDIGINRTQFNRYLNGESFPRPDVLQRICIYFKVDARILTEPLQALERAQDQDESNFFAPAFEPVSQSVLPDGIYEEWKLSWLFKDAVNFHLVQVKTVHQTRWVKIKCADTSQGPEAAYRRGNRSISFIGQAYAQATGFFIFDRQSASAGLAFTVFRKGFYLREDLYVGYKLSGNTFHQHRQRSRGPVVLRKIDDNCRAVLRSARHPAYIDLKKTPPEIFRALCEIESEQQLEGQGYLPSAQTDVPSK